MLFSEYITGTITLPRRVLCFARLRIVLQTPPPTVSQTYLRLISYAICKLKRKDTRPKKKTKKKKKNNKKNNNNKKKNNKKNEHRRIFLFFRVRRTILAIFLNSSVAQPFTTLCPKIHLIRLKSKPIISLEIRKGSKSNVTNVSIPSMATIWCRHTDDASDKNKKRMQ